MKDDRLTRAFTTVEAYLEHTMVPDPIGASALVADDLKITFTGGRKFTSPMETTAFNAKRYQWVKKRLGQTHGAWLDGTPFNNNRYIDTFIGRHGLIVETQVWNDSAEWLMGRSGLSEAAL